MEKQKELEAEEKNYNLKSDAVETLADADNGETPEYSQEELNRYRRKEGIRVSQWVKILLIKAWAAGAVCFFILWGLGLYVGNMLDMLVVLGVVLGMANDVLVNNILRFMETTPGENNRWMFFSKKGLGSFFGNILYALAIVCCVYLLYNGINAAFSAIFETTDTIYLGVEPILFGLFCMGFDMLFIWLKGLSIRLIEKVRAA